MKVIISLITTKIINANKRTSPTIENQFLTLAGISFLVIPSTIITNKCQPSSPGNGNKLTIPKLTEIIDQYMRKAPKPFSCNVLVVVTPIAIIPPTLFHASLSVNNEPKER